MCKLCTQFNSNSRKICSVLKGLWEAGSDNRRGHTHIYAVYLQLPNRPASKFNAIPWPLYSSSLYKRNKREREYHKLVFSIIKIFFSSLKKFSLWTSLFFAGTPLVWNRSIEFIFWYVKKILCSSMNLLFF